jgi:hypothetical protein
MKYGKNRERKKWEENGMIKKKKKKWEKRWKLLKIKRRYFK